jgi:predicted neuraminidase
MTAQLHRSSTDFPLLDRAFVTIDDARWRHCHASTVVRIADQLLVAWFAGSAEGADDTGIWLSRRELDGGWSPAERVDEGENLPHWNPVLAIAPNGMLWLFFKRGRRISEWQTLARTSVDGGRSWSLCRELVPDDRGGRGPVKNPPLVIGERWFAPASLERWPSSPHEMSHWDSFIDISDDCGRTWRRLDLPLDHTACRGAGAIQPALWRNAAGGVTALCRTSEGLAFRSSATASGMVDPVRFSELEPTELPNNNSGLAAVAFDIGGRRAVVCCHNSATADWGSRSTLVLSASLDDGRTWHTLGRVDGQTDDMGAATAGRPRGASDRGVDTDGFGEYSYPTLIVDGQTLIISYTWQRRGIVLATVPITALAETIEHLS